MMWGGRRGVCQSEIGREKWNLFWRRCNCRYKLHFFISSALRFQSEISKNERLFPISRKDWKFFFYTQRLSPPPPPTPPQANKDVNTQFLDLDPYLGSDLSKTATDFAKEEGMDISSLKITRTQNDAYKNDLGGHTAHSHTIKRNKKINSWHLYMHAGRTHLLFQFYLPRKDKSGKRDVEAWSFFGNTYVVGWSHYYLFGVSLSLSYLWSLAKKSQTGRQYLASKTPMPFQRQRGGGEEQWKCLLLPLHSFPTKSPPKRLFKKKRILLLLPEDVLRQIWQMALDPTPSLL